jgi:hypothetical protein
MRTQVTTGDCYVEGRAATLSLRSEGVPPARYPYDATRIEGLSSVPDAQRRVRRHDYALVRWIIRFEDDMAAFLMRQIILPHTAKNLHEFAAA